MNVRKFSAATSREALRLVRDTLGPDAVILSNRSQNGMVEILALAGEDMASLAEPVRERALQRYEPEPEPETFADMPGSLGSSVEPLVAAFAARREQTASSRPVQASASVRREPVAPAPPVAATSDMQSMMNEIRSMRGMLESQLAEIAWGSKQKREPMKAMVMREALAAGFSASLARYLVEKLPADVQARSRMKMPCCRRAACSHWSARPALARPPPPPSWRRVSSCSTAPASWP
jgi:flagellar biosynthesis protein FlhF